MASRRKSFMVGCIQYSRPETESDITMINGVVSFISKVASQEQDTYLDYVLAWCSEFERAARKSYIGPGIPSQTPRVVFSQLPFVRKGKCCHIMTTCTRTLSRIFSNPPHPTENDGSNIQLEHDAQRSRFLYYRATTVARSSFLELARHASRRLSGV